MLCGRSILRATATVTIIVVSGVGRLFAGEAQWNYVTTSGEPKSMDALKVPDPISARIVEFLGEDAESTTASVGDDSVVAVDTESFECSSYDILLQSGKIPHPTPKGVVWPDKDGRIVAKGNDPIDGRSAKVSRNPWIRESTTSDLPTGTEMSCGGIVIGGEKGPVALLNGRVVRVGDTLKGLMVREIIQEGVVLGLSALRYMVPKGRHVTITVSNN